MEQTPNQDNPLMVEGASSCRSRYRCLGACLLLKYKTRMDYINAIFNVVDWDKVAEFYKSAVKNTSLYTQVPGTLRHLFMSKIGADT